MKVNHIDWAIHNININMLLEMEQLSKKPGKSFDLDSFNFSNEDDIIATYSHSFNRFNKRVIDISINICLSCHKLCCKNNITNIEILITLEILLVMNTGKKTVNSLKLTIYPVILFVCIV